MPLDESALSRERVDLEAWYFDSLRPKVVRAAGSGVVESAAANELDRQLRELLELPDIHDRGGPENGSLEMSGITAGTPRGREAPLPLRPAEPNFAELAPDAYRAMLGLDGALWLEPRLRELVKVRIAQLDGAPDSLLRHARAAVELGESQSRLSSLAGWRNSSLFTPAERAALLLAEALVLASDKRTVAEARSIASSHFEPAELAQLVFACVAATAWDRLELGIGASRP
jgi:AhpD family alkylhydroperoxidase